YRAGQPAPEGTRLAGMGDRASDHLTDERLARVAALDALAQHHGHTVLDLAFGWLLSRPSVASVIAGATRPEQIAANVAAGGAPPTSPPAGGGRTPTCWPRSTPWRRATRPESGRGVAPRRKGPPHRNRSCRRETDERVVGHDGNGHVHRHQDGDGVGRLALVPD